MAFSFPRVYPILDSSFLPAQNPLEYLRRLGASLGEAGITLLEYRHKDARDPLLLAEAEVLREVLPPGSVKLILDDRADLVEQVQFDGVHVDAGDVSPSEARRLVGPDRIVGTFAGSDSLIPGILDTPADYFAIGPVFRTTTKNTDKAPIGIEGIRRLRAQAGPDIIFTAAAGITLETAPVVLEAGANTIAVAAAIFATDDPVREFRRWQDRLS